MTISTIVDSVYPAPSGIGIPTGVSITVLFDREIDENSIKEGGLFITGRDNDTWSGPDLQLLAGAASVGEESSALESPAYKGIVQGEIAFQRIDLVDDDLEVTTLDTIASGILFRHKAIFTPSRRLRENTEYKVFLVGDDDITDSFEVGVSDRTIFDSIASGINTGTGSVTLEGTYIGTADPDIYEITITTAGETGTSRFTFFKHSDLLTTYGPFRTRESGTLLSDGVTIKFADATYAVGDKFLFRVKTVNSIAGNMWWNFKTGSGAIDSIPDSISTSVIGDPITTTSTASTTFSVLSTSPVDETSNITIPASDYDVTITFDDDVDPDTVASGIGVFAYAEPSSGDPSVTASGLLTSTHSVDGAVITLSIASGQMYNNNLITITVDDSVTNTDGIALSADYTFWFTTAYTPLYCNVRRLRLMIGAYIPSVKDDTINLAIHLASIEADALTWNTANVGDNYYQFARGQWTCCKAAQILLLNVDASTGRLKSKELGDLKVTYDTTRGAVEEPLKRTDMCLGKWEGVLLAGGRQVQVATGVVKGVLDPDRPNVGRGWFRNSTQRVPAANVRARMFGQRRFGKGWWNRG